MDQIKRTTIDNTIISDRLIYKISVSPDESMVYLNVDYDSGKFTIEKTFRNNFFGLEDMEITINKLNTEKKVRKYLGLGEETND